MTWEWSALSAFFVLGLWGMSALTARRDVPLTPGQWALYVLWLLWTCFGIALTRTFAREGERRPARLTLAIFGSVSLIGGAALAYLWLW
jgi:hypothetical protein